MWVINISSYKKNGIFVKTVSLNLNFGKTKIEEPIYHFGQHLKDDMFYVLTIER